MTTNRQQEILAFTGEIINVTIGRYQMICHDPRYIGDFVALATDEVQRILTGLVSMCSKGRQEFSGGGAMAKIDSYHHSVSADVNPSDGSEDEELHTPENAEVTLYAVRSALQKANNDILVLRGQVEKREKMIHELRQSYFREISVTKEQVRQLQTRGKTDLQSVELYPWDQDPLKADSSVEEKSRLEAMVEEMRKAHEKEREDTAKLNKSKMEDLQRQIAALYTQQLAASADRHVVAAPEPVQVETADAEVGTDLEDMHAPVQPVEAPCIHCGKFPNDIVGEDTCEALAKDPEEGSQSSLEKEEKPPVRSGIDESAQTDPQSLTHSAVQTAREVIEKSVAVASVAVQVSMVQVNAEEQRKSNNKHHVEEKVVKDLEGQLANERLHTQTVRKELGEVKDQLFILKSKLVEFDEMKMKNIRPIGQPAVGVTDLREELLAKEQLLLEKSNDMARLQVELERVLAYHAGANVTQNPGPSWNMPALLAMRQGILDAEEAESAYRLQAWGHFRMAMRGYQALVVCRTEWEQHLQQSHDIIQIRRLERNIEALQLHFRRKTVVLRKRKGELREAANAAWDKVLFLSRSVIHCVHVEDPVPKESPRLPHTHTTHHIVPTRPSSGYQRPASAPSRDREPTPLRPVILEASAPAGTAIQLRTNLQRPCSAGVRRGVTPIVHQPSPQLPTGPTLFDPRQMMMMDSVAKRSRTKAQVSLIRQQAVTSDPTVIKFDSLTGQGLEPSHRRLITEAKNASAKDKKSVTAAATTVSECKK